MADEAKQAPKGEKPEDVKKVEEKKETVGEAMVDKKAEAKPEPKVVPEAAFLDLKNENKELRKDLKELKKLIEAGATKGEVADEIESLAQEYDIKPDFLRKLATSIRKDVEKETAKEIDEKVSSKLKPIEAKEREQKIDKIFNEHFKAAIEQMPEYADIVNPEVIKALSLDPANHSKTFAQLIEDTYGKAVPGKRTLESTKPGGGRAPEEIDFDRARKDSKYFDSIMADPARKKEYNEGMIERIKGVL
jgi:hypothetical protein